MNTDVVVEHTASISEQAEYSSEMIIPLYQIAWYHNSEDHNTNLYRRENLKYTYKGLFKY
jgi:hypothetical protein